MSKKQGRNYTTVSIPLALIERIDAVVDGKKHGYRSRSDFILDSIRKRLRELDYLI